MTPTLKTRTRKSAKKKVGRPVQVDETAAKKADGPRLQAALNQLGLSQAEAGRITGIPQGHISDIVNGQRDLYRKELRALARAGISADFILGATTEHIPPGQSRDPATLAHDLAADLTRELDNAFPLDRYPDNLTWRVDGAAALERAAEAIRAEGRAYVEQIEGVLAALREERALLDVLSLVDEHRAYRGRPPNALLHLRRLLADRRRKLDTPMMPGGAVSLIGRPDADLLLEIRRERTAPKKEAK